MGWGGWRRDTVFHLANSFFRSGIGCGFGCWTALAHGTTVEFVLDRVRDDDCIVNTFTTTCKKNFSDCSLLRDKKGAEHHFAGGICDPPDTRSGIHSTRRTQSALPSVLRCGYTSPTIAKDR